MQLIASAGAAPSIRALTRMRGNPRAGLLHAGARQCTAGSWGFEVLPLMTSLLGGWLGGAVAGLSIVGV
jgi:hypothetical protein